MHNTKFIFYLTILLLNIKCIQAQNITGTWEGLLSSEYLIINIIQENEQLFWWLLSYGANVEVLEPEALRKKIVNTDLS